MGCCGGDREKDAVIKNDVKWEYINLNDFKGSSCFAALAYAYLWIMLFVSISIYAVDTFTAINLLAFNRWAGQIEPEVPLKYSRWIFAGCIILSFVLLIYRWLRALKVMRGGKVAKSYLDPLAVRVECIRMGKEGRGWRRFLVFAELTKSRKGADYVALFVYFSFEAWLRILFAEGPRQVINGMTLYAYAEANIVPRGDHGTPVGQSPFVQFWKNFGVLAEQDKLQVAIIIGMLWTCLIWLISFISLAVSLILYLIFLWHHIPSDTGGLSGYCRMKINRRMERIVRTKTDKALKKENELRARQEAQAYREGTGDFKRQPTLPDLAGSTPTLPTLSRQTTMTTLPEYSSRPGTAASNEDTLPPMPTMPPNDMSSRSTPRRQMTNASDASWSSYNSNAPLMNGAGDMGFSPVDRIQTPASSTSTPWSARPVRGPPGSYHLEALQRPGTGMSQRSRPIRTSSDSDTLPSALIRGTTPLSAYPQSASSSRAPTLPDGQRTWTPANNGNPYLPPVSPIPEHGGRESPAFPGGPPRSHTPIGLPPRTMTPGHAPPMPRLQTSTPAPPGGYVAFNPNMERTQSPAPMVVTNQPYRSYGRPSVDRVDSPASSGSHSQYQSFSRPFSQERVRQLPQYGSGNLHPTKPNPPHRRGSFDDILDHY